MVHTDGNEGNARSKTAKTGDVLNSCTRLRGTSTKDRYHSGSFTNHMQRLSTDNEMQHNGRTIYISQHQMTVGGFF